MNKTVQKIKKETKGFGPEDLIKYVFEYFGESVALASGFGAEDQVLTDLICKNVKNPKIFTLDTGRLPQETYDVIAETRQKYGVTIKIYFPEAKKVEKMVNRHGPNLFYESVENRKLCCGIRKVEPLRRALSGLEAWVVGLRKGQSVTRFNTEEIAFDETNNIIKISPLADWSEDKVWQYIKNNNVPYNKLHDRGFPTIGCAPCTRAIKKGEDIRAGRWWWEEPEKKECGLHKRN